MVNEYTVTINGLGVFVVSVNIQRIANSKSSIECEIDVLNIKKYDDESEEYCVYEPSIPELDLIEQSVASQYFNSLH